MLLLATTRSGALILAKSYRSPKDMFGDLSCMVLGMWFLSYEYICTSIIRFNIKTANKSGLEESSRSTRFLSKKGHASYRSYLVESNNIHTTSQLPYALMKSLGHPRDVGTSSTRSLANWRDGSQKRKHQEKGFGHIHGLYNYLNILMFFKLGTDLVI